MKPWKFIYRIKVSNKIQEKANNGRVPWRLAFREEKATKYWPGTAYFDYVTVEARYLDEVRKVYCRSGL